MAAVNRKIGDEPWLETGREGMWLGAEEKWYLPKGEFVVYWNQHNRICRRVNALDPFH